MGVVVKEVTEDYVGHVEEGVGGDRADDFA